MTQLSNFPRSILIKLIHGYQKTLSLDHGPLRFLYPHGFCQFYPSCSQYAIESIERYGAARGSWRAAKRILRCNPFSKGGVDPVR